MSNTNGNPEELLSIQDCVRLYKLSTNTLRKWIKKNILPAKFNNNQYFIRKEDIETLLLQKGLLHGNTEITTDTTTEVIHTTTETTTGLPQDTIIIELRKENEFLKEKIRILEQDKQFLQAQVQQLTNTLSLLTTRQLPEPKGVIDRIKGWFRKE
ncbi:helix-turn-helix domain-containing protein [bacterium]|nr:helix-turn-helix domain-containing protein [bacterium]